LNPAALTLITQSTRIPEARFFTCLEAALQAGLPQVLVREPAMDSARLLAFAARIGAMCRSYHARVVIHTQADIARAIGADGVHLPGSAMIEIPHIRAWLHDESISLSTSCHTIPQLEAAKQYGADWAFLSPVFTTTTHPEIQPLGVQTFQSMANASPLPVVALGGIHAENRKQLAAYAVAVISAILDADDVRASVQALHST